MKENKCNILVCGLLQTGSSALIDLLREYDNIHVISNEFDDFRAPGLVADQLNFSQDAAFPNEIKSLTKLSVKLRLIYNVFPIFKFNYRTLKGIKSRFNSARVRLKQLSLLEELNRNISSDISFSEKIKLTNAWINDIGRIELKKQKHVVFNQPVHSALNTQIWSKVFDPWKLIIVYRDPKDQIADVIKNNILYKLYGAPFMSFCGVTLESIYGRSRKGALECYMEAIKERYAWINTLKAEFNPDQLLIIDFEGLVNNYDTYKIVIENFLGDIKSHHTKQKLYFDPNKAKKSVGMYPKFLSKDEIESLAELGDIYKHTRIESNSFLKAINSKRIVSRGP